MSSSTYLGYQSECFESFYDGSIYYDADFNALEDDTETVYEAKFDWKLGNGLICLFVATFGKLIDIHANLVVQTPTITRDHKEQEEYEALSGDE
jgi:hypothetical protein